MSESVSTHLFWIVSRGAGITALLLSSVSVGFGLVMAAKLRKGSTSDRRAYHEILSLSVMVAIAVHGLSLIGDSYLHPSLADVTVPFVFSYETLATSLGILAGWSLLFLGLSYYLRRRIGPRRWRLIHRFTVLAWLAGLIHALTEGTDAGQAWFLVAVGLTAAPVLVLLAARYRPRARLAGYSRRTAARQAPATTH